MNTTAMAAALAALSFGPLALAEGLESELPSSCTGTSGILHDQLPGASPMAINSQYYGSLVDDNAAADDFVVPPGVSWTIKRVVVKGDYFSGAAPPAQLVNVTFYDVGPGGVPGNVLCSYPNVPAASWGTPANVGNLVVQNLNCTLPSGAYFVSVVANMGFAGGQWGWRAPARRVRPPPSVDSGGAPNIVRASFWPGAHGCPGDGR